VADADFIGRAVSTLCADAPAPWLHAHFERTVSLVRVFYVNGVGRLPNSEVRKKLQLMMNLAMRLEDEMTGWGALFALQEGDFRAFKAVSLNLSGVIDCAKKAINRLPVKSGPGAASMAVDPLSLKQIIALSVWQAAEELDLTKCPALHMKTAQVLLDGSGIMDWRLFDSKLWGGINPSKPPAAETWDSSFRTAKKIQPRRDDSGALVSDMLRSPLKITAGDVASFFILERRSRLPASPPEHMN
jgi:hypothetical protein